MSSERSLHSQFEGDALVKSGCSSDACDDSSLGAGVQGDERKSTEQRRSRVGSPAPASPSARTLQREPDEGPVEQALHAVGLDPVCAFHGKRWSEHEGGRCLYCCICFETNPASGWATDSEGTTWDVCNTEECRYLAGLEKPRSRGSST